MIPHACKEITYICSRFSSVSMILLTTFPRPSLLKHLRMIGKVSFMVTFSLPILYHRSTNLLNLAGLQSF